MSSDNIEYKTYSAAIDNDVEELKELFAELGKMDPSIKPYGQSLLLHAVLSNASDSANFLLENGFDVNEADHNGYTPLHGAAEKGNVEMVRLLLEKGARPNVKDIKGNTPLSKAIFNSGEDISLIRELVAGGADPEFVFYPGMDARLMARKLGKQSIVDFFESLKKT